MKLIVQANNFFHIDFPEGQSKKECKWRGVNDHFGELINFFFKITFKFFKQNIISTISYKTDKESKL